MPEIAPEAARVLPVVEQNGCLLGIVEADDFLKAFESLSAIWRAAWARGEARGGRKRGRGPPEWLSG